jgi:soluble lytic murein transglycosylase
MYKHCKRVFALLLVLLTVLISACLFGCASMEEQYPRKYSEIVTEEAKNCNLEEALVYAVIKAESNFDANAVSRVGAMGLMQLMPSTFQWMLDREGNTQLTEDDITNPSINIRYGCHYLAYLSTKYSSVYEIAAAYNAGDGAVDLWLNDDHYSSDGVHLDSIPYPETASYAEKVTENYKTYLELYYSNEEEST